MESLDDENILAKNNMANTYTQIHIQCVFAPMYRQAIISREWSERLHHYITAIVQNHSHKMIAINSMPDHLHMFFGMRPNQSLSDLMRIVKGESSEWINKQRFTMGKFVWQEGFGGFSYDKSRIPIIASYIENQELHHRNKSLQTEYKELLDEFGISYDDKYIFKDPI